MSASLSGKSPLAGLVLFMIGLAIFGSMVAGAHYLAVDLPHQNNVQTPHNGIGLVCDSDCMDSCHEDNDKCLKRCGTTLKCRQKCTDVLGDCTESCCSWT